MIASSKSQLAVCKRKANNLKLIGITLTAVMLFVYKMLFSKYNQWLREKWNLMLKLFVEYFPLKIPFSDFGATLIYNFCECTLFECIFSHKSIINGIVTVIERQRLKSINRGINRSGFCFIFYFKNDCSITW